MRHFCKHVPPVGNGSTPDCSRKQLIYADVTCYSTRRNICPEHPSSFLTGTVTATVNHVMLRKPMNFMLACCRGARGSFKHAIIHQNLMM